MKNRIGRDLRFFITVGATVGILAAIATPKFSGTVLRGALAESGAGDPTHFAIISNLNNRRRVHEGILHASAEPASGPISITVTAYRQGVSPPPTVTLTTDAFGYARSLPLLPPGDPDTLIQIDAPAPVGLLLVQDGRRARDQLVIAVPDQSKTVGTSFLVPRLGSYQFLLVGNPGTTDTTVRVHVPSLSTSPTVVALGARTVARIALPAPPTLGGDDGGLTPTVEEANAVVQADSGVIVQTALGSGDDATLVAPVS